MFKQLIISMLVASSMSGLMRRQEKSNKVTEIENRAFGDEVASKIPESKSQNSNEKDNEESKIEGQTAAPKQEKPIDDIKDSIGKGSITQNESKDTEIKPKNKEVLLNDETASKDNDTPMSDEEFESLIEEVFGNEAKGAKIE